MRFQNKSFAHTLEHMRNKIFDLIGNASNRTMAAEQSLSPVIIYET